MPFDIVRIADISGVTDHDVTRDFAWKPRNAHLLSFNSAHTDTRIDKHVQIYKNIYIYIQT